MLMPKRGSMRTSATTLLALIALTAAALPGQTRYAVHHDHLYQSYAFSIARNTWRPFGSFDYPQVLSVPRFDPALGELQSAQLTIDGACASEMVSHAQGPFFVRSTYDVTYSTSMDPDSPN